MVRGIKKGLSLTLAIVLIVPLWTIIILSTTENVGGRIVLNPIIQHTQGDTHGGGFGDCELDSNDNIHILTYQWESGWYTTNNEGLFKTYYLGWHARGSLAIDSNDKIYLSYSLLNHTEEPEVSEWVYSTVADGTWRNETIERGNYGVVPQDIAVDSLHDPHIVYTDLTNYETPSGWVTGYYLNYTTKIGDSWNHQTIEDVETSDAQMKIDSDDKINIIYKKVNYQDQTALLMYATNTNGVWYTHLLDEVDIYCSITFMVDPEDNLHLLYRTGAGVLKYGFQSATNWDIRSIASDVPRSYSMALDSQNNAHIIYPDDEGLNYISNTGNTWQLVHIPYDFAYFQDASDVVNLNLVIDSRSYAHIILGYSDSHVSYATNMEGSWSIQSLNYLVEELNGSDVWGTTGFLGVDTMDRIHLVYDTGLNPSAIHVLFSPTVLSVPDGPTNFSALPGNNQVYLSWTPPIKNGGSPIIGYNLSWSNDPNGPFTSIVVNGTTYLHEGLENGRTYYYKVTAVNAEGEGEPSSTISATPTPIISVPSVPLNLVAHPYSNSIMLSWNPPAEDGGSAITGYNLSYSLYDNGPYASIIVNGTSYLYEGLENGRTYYYQVSAINVAGEGNKTDVISAIPTASSILPSAPTNLIASVANGDVSLSWESPSDDENITGYKVYRGTSPLSIQLLVSTANATFLDTTVTGNHTYYYQVSAVNSSGESNRSNTVIVMTPSSNAREPSPSFFETIEGQIAIAGMIVAGVGAVGYTVWRYRRH